MFARSRGGVIVWMQSGIPLSNQSIVDTQSLLLEISFILPLLNLSLVMFSSNNCPM